MLGMENDEFYDDIPECPLCLEPLGLDDINFYPCACRYQICRFCWHRIRTDENGLCPHCREIYPENPAEYTPPTQEQLAKTKSEKKQKEQCKRQKVVESREKLASVRVVQRNLVFAIGLSPRLADPEVLKRNEYFGKYGKIYKVVINNHTIYNGAQGPSVSAYVTYCRNEDASKAIAAVNNAFIDGRSLKASFGTTKYCTSFLKGAVCTKPDCMYLHELGEDEASFTKEDMQLGKHQIFENATLASLLPPGTMKENQSLAVETEGEIKPAAAPRAIIKEPVLQLDVAESALPVTAHWASNQKIHNSGSNEGSDGGGGGGGNGELSGPEISNSITHQRDSSKPSPSQTHSPTSIVGTEHSTNSHTRNAAGGSTTKRLFIEIGDSKHDSVEPQEENTAKLISRSGSTSPNTPKNRIPEQVATRRQSGRETQEKELSRTSNNSPLPPQQQQQQQQPVSLSKSLSPRGNLSASTSSGSLRQDTEDASTTAATVRGSGVPVGRGDGSSGGASVGRGDGGRAARETEVNSEVVQATNTTVRQTTVTSGPRKKVTTTLSPSENTVDAGMNLGSRRNLEEIGRPALSLPEQPTRGTLPFQARTVIMTIGDESSHPHSKPLVGSSRDGVSHSIPNPSPPVPSACVGGTTTINTPPTPPISSPPGLSKVMSAVIEPPTLATQSDRVCRQLDLRANPSSLVGLRSAADRTVLGSGVAERTMVGQAQEKGGGKEGEERRERRNFVQEDRVSNNVITSFTSAGNSHFGALGVNWNIPHTGSSSSPHTPHSNLPHLNSTPSPLPGSLIHPQQQQNPALSSREQAPYLSKSSKSAEQADDGDELGFDPWDVSQQGLADLLETEAKQQRKPHPFGAIPNSAHLKGGQNGINSFMGQNTPLYRNWQGHVPSRTMPSSAATLVGSRDAPTGSDSLRDEFRALFPNVNISFGGTGSKQSNLEKPSSLVQALDASNPSTSAYLPTQLATALNYSYQTPSYRPMPPHGHTHLPTASKHGPHPPYSDGANLFLGQSQPGFPASSFKVKGSNSGVSSATTSSGATTAATMSMAAPDAVSRTTASRGRNTYSNCLGPDWPDLGIAVGQITKSQSVQVTSSSSSSSTLGMARNRSGEGKGSEGHLWKVPPSDGTESRGTVPVSMATVVVTSGITANSTSSALPSPPPGFSKAAPLPSQSHFEGGVSRGVMATAATVGSGNQTATTTANPILMANSKGQILPNHLLQSWTNYRNLANLTPAQQQQLARNNQITYQQLLAQQYLFQQAMLRNPLLQAQSLRMAQLHQQALLQQQQQAAMAAGLASGGVSSAGAIKVNPSMSTSSAIPNSKLLVSMAGELSLASMPSSSMVIQSGTTTTASATKIVGNLNTGVNTANASSKAGGGGGVVGGTKTSRQNGANDELSHVHYTGVGGSGSSRSSTQNNISTEGSSSVKSSSSAHITGPNTTSPVSSVGSSTKPIERQHPPSSSSSFSSFSSSRTSKQPAKAKGGGGGHHTTNTPVNMDKKSRQKSK